LKRIKEALGLREAKTNAYRVSVQLQEGTERITKGGEIGYRDILLMSRENTHSSFHRRRWRKGVGRAAKGKRRQVFAKVPRSQGGEREKGCELTNSGENRKFRLTKHKKKRTLDKRRRFGCKEKRLQAPQIAYGKNFGRKIEG